MAEQHITPANIFLAGALIVGVITATGGLAQYQLSQLNEKINNRAEASEKRDADARHDREIRDRDVARRFERIDDQFNARRHEFTTIEQYQDLKDRVAAGEERIKVIEQTRPTTGVLEAGSKATETMMQRFEERLRGVESQKQPGIR